MFDNRVLWNDYSHAAVLQRVTVYECLSYEARKTHYIFNFFRRDVLSLRKFEYIFAPIDDFHTAIWENLNDITGCEPTIFVESLCSLCWIVEVALENDGTFH